VIRFQPDVDRQLARAAEVTAQLRGIRRLAHGGSHSAQDLRAWLEKVLEAAIELTDADFGYVQLVDQSKHVLRMVVQRGFSRETVRHFKEVNAGQASCGTAMQRLRCLIVENVEHDPIFRDPTLREPMLKANARAMQSTPLFGRSGKLVGMISTHYNVSRRPPARGLRYLDLLAWQIQSQLDDSLRIDADVTSLEI
jgi:GAF domain-containing protein